MHLLSSFIIFLQTFILNLKHRFPTGYTKAPLIFISIPHYNIISVDNHNYNIANSSEYIGNSMNNIVDRQKMSDGS